MSFAVTVKSDAQKTPVEGLGILPYEKGKTYTVTYEANGATTGTAPTQEPVEGGKTVTVSGEGALVRTGYDFDGWKTDDGTTYKAGDTFVINRDTAGRRLHSGSER
jgi:uncharacterized repeat protein (TIGR02543 family)